MYQSWMYFIAFSFSSEKQNKSKLTPKVDFSFLEKVIIFLLFKKKS